MTIARIAKTLLGVKNIVVDSIEIENEKERPELVIKARPYNRDMCRCGICGKAAKRYDKGRGTRRWRGLDIGEGVELYVESEAPRVKCEEHGVVVQWVPWGRHGSHFVKNFEDTAVWLSLHLSRKSVAEYLRVKWETVGQMVTRVEKELSQGKDPYANMVRIGVDETSYKKGHKYLTVIVNHDTNTVIWAAKGHGRAIFETFFEGISKEQKEKIRLVSGDGARWIRDTVEANCPNATFCVDPFHVVSWCTEVMDQVRREEWNKAREMVAAERKKQPKKKRSRSKKGEPAKTKAEQRVDAMKNGKYPLLLNPEKLGESYRAKLQQVLLLDRKLATAYRLKEELRLIFKLPTDEIPSAIDRWRRRAWSCRIPQFVELQRKIKRHKNAIIATVTNGLSNARIEATNNKIKLTIRMAYGFRNISNLISMIMLRCGGTPIHLPGRGPAVAA